LDRYVVFNGYREDVPRLLHGFDSFCLASFSEGLPVCLLEAMAAGVPVIGSNVRGIREVISHMETGLLFPSNDVDALTHAFEILIDNPRLASNLKKKAFGFVCQNHGMEQWVSRYERLFDSSKSA
jgi:glycosyltransferase involved in cell wall biosynthesis